jgi:hypothetical protein
VLAHALVSLAGSIALALSTAGGHDAPDVSEGHFQLRMGHSSILLLIADRSMEIMADGTKFFAITSCVRMNRAEMRGPFLPLAVKIKIEAIPPKEGKHHVRHDFGRIHRALPRLVPSASTRPGF